MNITFHHFLDFKNSKSSPQIKMESTAKTKAALIIVLIDSQVFCLLLIKLMGIEA